MSTKKRTAQGTPVPKAPEPTSENVTMTQESRIEEGNKAFMEKRYESALKFYHDAMTHDPQDPALIAKVATTYYKLRDFTNAVKYFKSALEILPKDKDLLYTLGMVYVKMADKSSALSIYEKLVKIRPDKADELYKAIYS